MRGSREKFRVVLAGIPDVPLCPKMRSESSGGMMRGLR